MSYLRVMRLAELRVQSTPMCGIYVDSTSNAPNLFSSNVTLYAFDGLLLATLIKACISIFL